MLLALLLARLVLAAAAPAAAPAAAAASMPTASFAASAHAVRQGGKMRVTNYKLEGDMSASTLELTRIEVFTPTAQVGAGRGRAGQCERATQSTGMRGSARGGTHFAKLHDLGAACSWDQCRTACACPAAANA